MWVYGYDSSTDVDRGEIYGAEVDRFDLLHPGQLKARLGWDHLSTRFADVKKQLIIAMKSADVDEELIATVREIKASYVQV